MSDAIQEIESAERRLHRRSRRLLGVSGAAEYGPLRDAFRASRLPWYPAVALGLLAAVDVAALIVISLLRPDITATNGGSWLGVIGQARVAALLVASVVALRMLDRGVTRVALARIAPVLTALALVGAAFANTRGVVVAAAAVSGVGALAAVTHRPLLMDWYRPEVRVRVFALYTAGVLLGVAGAAGLAAAYPSLGLSWRGLLLLLAIVALVAAVVASRMREPAEGRWDALPTAAAVHAGEGGLGGHPAAIADDEVALGVGERLRRVTAVPSARGLLMVAGAFGLFVIPLQDYVLVLFRDRWDLTTSARPALYALVCLAALPGLLWMARRGEVAYRRGPEHLLAMLRSAVIVGAVAFVVAAGAPLAAIGVLALAVGFGAMFAVLPATAVLLLSIVPPALRPHASAQLGIAVAVGTDVGRQLLGTIGGRFGVEWGIRIAALALLGVGLSLRRGRIDHDLDHTVTSMLEQEKLRVMVSQGRHLPLLDCRRIDFSYGQVRVLFDVDFSVDEGEMVALLGTNGAGKSTLLRVISGLGVPSRGAVHYRGADITFVDTARRVQLGILQVPGGRAVFGPMSVVDNLRVFGYGLGRDRRAVDRAIETTFDAFPALADRRNQTASTLSGGEQQMLGLGRAIIREPRLLLIDELSLGLAPIIVGQLLDMVRRINEAGTAVVLVEQSVNIALALVSHAYFMEKGEIRFDGRAADLLHRQDLLRSVFLEGAAAAIPAAAST